MRTTVTKDDRFKDMSFVHENGYSWDLAIILPFTAESMARSKDGEPSSNIRVHDPYSEMGNSFDGEPTGEFTVPKLTPEEIVRRMNEAGLETFLFYSVKKDKLICKVRAPVDRLAQHADQIDYKMKMDEERVKEVAEWGIPDKNIKRIFINHDPTISKRRPYEYIYARYDTEDRLRYLYEEAEGLRHPFSAMHRIKLLNDILKTPPSQNGCGLILHKLVENESILAFYPLHSIERREELMDIWIRQHYQWPWQQPLNRIRDYFGEKIGLYFCFLGHYTSWLLPISIVGLIVGIDMLAEMTTQPVTSPYFSAIVSFWCIFMLEFWKRKESTMAMEWGMTGFEEEERDRPEFEGKTIRSFVDGSPMTYYPPESKRGKLMQSQSVIFSMIVLVVGAVAAVFFLKIFLTEDVNDQAVNDMGSSIASIANAIQIQVMNWIYSEIAVWLTNRENHRTDTQYEDSLIAKLFAFQFVNSYASLYYIAFIKNSTEGCDYSSCMDELCNALGIIFVTRLLTGNLSETLGPYIKGYLRKREEEKEAVMEAPMSRVEEEFNYEPYDEMMGSLEDYAELSIQFGYVTLFVTAFPVAPLLAYISNYIEIRVDGYKILWNHRRPIPQGAEDIGTWQDIFYLTSIFAVITNAGVICFTMDVFDFESDTNRVWFFIVFQYAIIAIMGLFAYIVEDVPDDVIIQLKRREFLVSKIVDCIEDEDEDFDIQHIENVMTVHDRDDEAPLDVLLQRKDDNSSTGSQDDPLV